MQTRPAVTTADVFIGVMIALAVVVGAVAVLGVDPWGEPGGPNEGIDDGLARLRKIDPALIQYRQTGELPVRMQAVRALAVGPDDRIYVGGDKAIQVFEPGGDRLLEIVLDGEPKCLAVGAAGSGDAGGAGHVAPGRVYVGVGDHVELFDEQGKREATWDGLGRNAVLTSLAVAEQDVFVADAGNRVVWHYDASGKRKGQIGKRDDQRGIPGFAIPSPYFDVAVAPDGLLRVVNPGALRIEAYTFEGDLETSWTRRSSVLEGFFGCCNPAHFAVFADGRLVTAEKGIARVKVYDDNLKFICVVSGPEQLDVEAADVAVDGRDRILFLDPKAKSVRVFEHKKDPSRAGR